MGLEQLTEALLLAFLAVTAGAVIRLRNLVGVVMLAGIYSLLTAALFADLNAVDVAFTEAVVGAGISTVLFLLSLALTGEREQDVGARPLLPLLVTAVTGAALLYGVSEFPAPGDPGSPPNTHVAPEYLERTADEIGVPNVVTAVLASYRGFDTLGETTVIFTAAVGVFLLLGEPRRRRR
jgi:multicomponent Na+:H+ antiporter subunit B